MKTPEERFYAKVDTSGECWVWTGHRRAKGYGGFQYLGKYMRAHRASYLLHVGEIPDGLFVLHSCDNQSCVNPAHLFLGTQLDNIRDCMSKGRSAKKRNQDLWDEVSRRFHLGQTVHAIGKTLGVDHQAVRYILRREGIS